MADHLEAAIAELETARRLMPGNAQVHFFLAQVYRRAGRQEDAQRETVQFEKLKAQQDPLGVPGLLQSADRLGSLISFRDAEPAPRNSTVATRARTRLFAAIL